MIMVKIIKVAALGANVASVASVTAGGVRGPPREPEAPLAAAQARPTAETTAPGPPSARSTAPLTEQELVNGGPGGWDSGGRGREILSISPVGGNGSRRGAHDYTSLPGRLTNPAYAGMPRQWRKGVTR